MTMKELEKRTIDEALKYVQLTIEAEAHHDQRSEDYDRGMVKGLFLVAAWIQNGGKLEDAED